MSRKGRAHPRHDQHALGHPGPSPLVWGGPVRSGGVMAQQTLDPQQLDHRYLVDTLVRLLKVPTEVPLGPNTLMEPDDPKLVHYVQEIVRPELQRIGVYSV